MYSAFPDFRVICVELNAKLECNPYPELLDMDRPSGSVKSVVYKI